MGPGLWCLGQGAGGRQDQGLPSLRSDFGRNGGRSVADPGGGLWGGGGLGGGKKGAGHKKAGALKKRRPSFKQGVCFTAEEWNRCQALVPKT